MNIEEIEISKLDSFANHPFKAKYDLDMQKQQLRVVETIINKIFKNDCNIEYKDSNNRRVYMEVKILRKLDQKKRSKKRNKIHIILNYWKIKLQK